MQTKDLLLAPIYLYQGSKLKRNTIRLPEAKGERCGILSLQTPQTQFISSPNAPDSKQLGRTLNLMIVGDSSAAGVGVDRQDEALVGQLLKALPLQATVQQKFAQINWQLYATTGHTSFDALRRLYVLPKPAAPVDIMTIVIGVNDTTGNIGEQRWQSQLNEIIAIAKRKFAAKQIIFSCLPPMAHMPAIPSPLNEFIGAKADKLDKKLQQVCAKQDNVTYLAVDFKSAGFSADKMFAIDGFHPNAAAYEYWASELASLIAQVV